MRRTEGGAICLQILFRSGRQRFERINALVVYENTQVQMWACGPAGRADGCDDLPLRNSIAGFGIECTQMRVHRPDAVFMLQRHMIAVGFAVAAKMCIRDSFPIFFLGFVRFAALPQNALL